MLSGMASLKRTYFIPANFNNLHPGSLQLGQLITCADDPHYSLEPKVPKPLNQHGLSFFTKSRRAADCNSDLQSASKARLLTTAVSHVAAKSGWKADSDTLSSVLAGLEKIAVESFEPDDAYVFQSMTTPAVQDFLRERQFRQLVYMITALKIAHPSGREADLLTRRSEESTKKSGGAKGSHKVIRAPKSGGSSASKSDRQHGNFAFIPTQPFIYAYELRACRYGVITPQYRQVWGEGDRSPRQLAENDVGDLKDGYEFDYRYVDDESLELQHLGKAGHHLRSLSQVDELEGHFCDCVLAKE